MASDRDGDGDDRSTSSDGAMVASMMWSGFGVVSMSVLDIVLPWTSPIALGAYCVVGLVVGFILTLQVPKLIEAIAEPPGDGPYV